MKFLAILKDSYREARSGWVLQLLFLLSALILLLIASISFRPTTVQSEMESGFRLLNWAFGSNPEFKSVKFGIDEYSETNPAEPWKSDYAFDLYVQADKPETIKKITEMQGLPGTRYRAERFMKQSLDFLENVKVETKTSSGPTELRFRVTTKGTKTPDQMSWRHVPSVLFAFEAPIFPMSLREGVYYLENYIIGGFGAWIILFISVVITAGFIPAMMQKGAIDLAISKPISRPMLLIYKYIGGLTYMVLISVFLIGGTWIILGIRNGIWSPQILMAIPVMTFYFSVLYAVSTLFGVLTRSTIVAIMATLLAWLLCFAIGKVNNGVVKRLEREANPPKKLEDLLPRPGEQPETPDPDEIISQIDPNSPLWGFIPKATFTPIRVIHAMSPRTYQLDDRLSRLIARGILTEPELERKQFNKPASASWLEILGVSTAWIVFILGLATLRFVTRSF